MLSKDTIVRDTLLLKCNMKIAFIDVGYEYHALYVTFNEVSRH